MYIKLCIIFLTNKQFPIKIKLYFIFIVLVAVFDMSCLSSTEIDNDEFMFFDLEIESIAKKIKNKQIKNIHEIYEKIFKGGMPKLVITEIDRDRYYMDYVNTYIERDIKNLTQVGKLDEFYNFLVYMAARTGQELKYDDISKSIGITAPAVKTWVSLLEKSGIIVLIRPYHSSMTKRLVKTPKMYFMDTGLAIYLCRWPDPYTLENGAMDGAFLETYA